MVNHDHLVDMACEVTDTSSILLGLSFENGVVVVT